ncbi:hypothetical protein [Virgibacillus halodenitrificans]|uniref:hypothetical protein n=1 Tax=Virgibacillus halodenitrificans TaxID=1482 RepID=UPI00045C891D|nr:hypothetical protein [Virgibacillus halodenitrificans]CDQ37716.1 hypothetical protein BN993_07278 [Virgibacillus halodenitrificans]
MNKKLMIISGVMVISLILNVVIYSNLGSVQEEVKKDFKEEIEEKESNIASLEVKIKDLNEVIKSDRPEDRKKLSNTKLEEQEEYKTIASDFIYSYLEYDTDNLKERRAKLSQIADEKLVNRIAPEPIDQEESQLSSDPTFISEIEKINIYIADIDEITKKNQIIADVKYDTKSTEGEASVRSLISLQLEKNEDDSIRVMTYEYYPIN